MSPPSPCCRSMAGRSTPRSFAAASRACIAASGTPRALGLRPWRVLRLVILPQALKPMLAPYVNQSVTQLKNTSLVSVIAVPDLVYNATLINAETYRPLEVYTIVALIYFAILFPATLVARRFERGMTYDKA